jgi:glycosyltransferase involved in cell wall biosynthesis
MKKCHFKLSIVIPVFNEQENISLLYREIKLAIDPLKILYEIIFVDDGSQDNTFRQLKALKATEITKNDNNFLMTKIIRFSRNFGQTAAMQAGFDHATGDVVIAMDGDLQNDPKDIPRLLKKLNEGYDVVSGWRKDRKDRKISRIIPSKIANWLISKITGVYVHDNGCSLKAYRKSVLESVKLYSDMHRFIPALTTLAGANIAELVVNHRPRRYGVTKYGLSRTWRVLCDIITVKMIIHFNERPLVWFLLLSTVFLALGVFLGIISIIQFYSGQASIVYFTSSFLLLSVFGYFMILGILGEYITHLEF